MSTPTRSRCSVRWKDDGTCEPMGCRCCEKDLQAFSVVLDGEFADKKISAEKALVFSADLWYNEANEKPRPLGEVAAKPTERANGGKNTPSHPLSRELSQGESLWMTATKGVWALPEARVASNAVIQRRNWR